MAHPSHKASETPEKIKAIITTAYPQFQGTPVVYLGEGYDFRAFEVGSRWLFRFPKHEDSATKLIMERGLLPGLQAWVSLPIPDYAFFASSGEKVDRPFAGYAKLSGVPGDESPAIDWPEVARQLGHFLGGLHSYPVDRAKTAGVPEEVDLVAQRRDQALEELAGNVDFFNDYYDVLNRYLEDGPSSSSGIRSRLVHNDLWPEHVLFDPASGRVTAVIDWGDALIGDPAVDYAALYTWGSESWVENVLEHYPKTVDTGAISRARLLATCLAIHNISLGQNIGHSKWITDGQAVLRMLFTT